MLWGHQHWRTTLLGQGLEEPNLPGLHRQLLFGLKEGIIPMGRAEARGAANQSTLGCSWAPGWTVCKRRSKS